LLNYFHIHSSAPAALQRVPRAKKDLNMKRLYQRLVGELGRNQALYRAASVAREYGWGQAAVEGELLPVHVAMPAPPTHASETAAARLREGQRTIDSAYRGGRQISGAAGGIPNSVRERLLQQQRSTIVARFLDILRLAKWQPDSYFTLKEAIFLAAGQGLGRKSVLQALTGELSTFDGRQIISRRYVEYLDIRGLKSKKRGRPIELVFQVPTIGRLLQVLKVPFSPSDPLRVEDLSSARSYRQALHREYIHRLSPQAPIAVLARRLGLHGRSIRRYNRALGAQATERIAYFSLKRPSLASLPRKRRSAPKNATPGYWLEAFEGRRFPAWRHIGEKLLKKGKLAVRVCWRLPSAWSLAPGPAPPPRYEPRPATDFLRLRATREGAAGDAGLLQKLKALLADLHEHGPAAHYEKFRLRFDSVAERIASDKFAATIDGYLYARDAQGRQLRRPARRGIAYRMLKEFGEGNVFLALRESYSETLLALARGALQAGRLGVGMNVLGRLLGGAL